MNNRGITLTELVIVLSILGILIVALGFSFQGWIGGYRTESQMKEMYGDLMNARANAMSRARVHFVTLAVTQYSIYQDTDPSPNGNGYLNTAADTLTLQRTLNTSYPITWNIAGAQIDFDIRGLTNNQGTICSNTDADTDYNCIVISRTRINLGKLTTTIPDGGACNATNCVEK